MPCGCVNNKKLDLEDMKNMSVDDIVRLYKDGYILEGMSNDLPSNLPTIGDPHIGNNNIFSASPDPVTILFAQGYQQNDGLHITVDLLVRSHNTTDLVIKFDFNSTDATPIPMGYGVACIPPYSTPGFGCSKIRFTNLLQKDPFTIKTYRCITTPNCAAPSCATFGTIWDDYYVAEVVNYGLNVVPAQIFGDPVRPIPPSINMAVECASCEPSWTCILDAFGRKTGDKYDSCTGQTVRDTAFCPLPTIPMSQISIFADKLSPFNKGDIVTFYGVLQSAASPYGNIAGADLHILIKLGVDEVTYTDVHVTTTPATTGNNWSYPWTVPPTMANVDTAGMNVKIIVNFGGNPDYQASSSTNLFGIGGITCQNISIAASKTTATQGDSIAVRVVTNPPGYSFPVRVKANNIPVAPIPSGQTGQCTTTPSLSGLSNISILPGYEIGRLGIGSRIYSMVDSITIENPPSVVVPGQQLKIRVSYDVTVAGFPGDVVRLRICDTTAGKPVREIGSVSPWWWGRTVGFEDISVTIPTDASISITLRAEVSHSAWEGRCGMDLIVDSMPVDIPVVQQPTNSLVLLTQPITVVKGQKMDFTIRYVLPIAALSFVSFKICSDIGTLGATPWVFISSGEARNAVVSTTIPDTAPSFFNIWAEVTEDQGSTVCGDTQTFLSTDPISVHTSALTANTLSFVELPTSVIADQTVDIKMAYYITGLLAGGEFVRFRICSGGNEIGNSIVILSGNASGTVIINVKIPSGATTSISMVGEATTDETSATCGDAQVVARTIATGTISVFPPLPGSCTVTWDTNKWYNPQVENSPWPAGTYNIIGQVIGTACTSETVTVKLAARRLPCTRVSIGIDKIEPNIGDEVLLTAVTEPVTQSYEAIFKLDGKSVGQTCTTVAGRCTTATKWKIPTTLSVGDHSLTAEIVGPSGATECKSVAITITVGAAPTTHVGTITFVVTCAESPCEGASIINTATGKPIGDSTGADGKTTVQNLPAGALNFKAVKSGYNDGSGSVTVVEATTIIANTVNLTVSTASKGTLHFIAKTEGNPLTGTKVTLISARLTGTTDASGIVDFPDLTMQSSYTYKVEKSGYNTRTGAVADTAFTTSPTNVPIDMVLSSVTPTAGGGGAMMIAAVAAIGIAYFMMKKPPTGMK